MSNQGSFETFVINATYEFQACIPALWDAELFAVERQKSYWKALGTPHVHELLCRLKRAGGMSLQDLSDRMSLSYSATRKHCTCLEKLGLLSSSQERVQIGRPRRIFRVTREADCIFAQSDRQMLISVLETAEEELGREACRKLLTRYFQEMEAEYLPRITGKSVAERTLQFAGLRAKDGYFSDFEIGVGGRFRLIEFHSPIWELAARYPAVAELEQSMVSNLIGTRCFRTMETWDRVDRVVFLISQG